MDARPLRYAAAAGLLAAAHTAAGEWSGSVTAQARWFPSEPLRDEQFSGAQLSLALEAEYAHSWDDGRQLLVFAPFARLDQRDDERSHVDVRELAWIKATDDWELRVGIRRVFWGVTEFQHLVDIINQTDLVENPDGEDKLGQPMVNFALVRGWGTLDFFVLPGFRERTFPGREGRLSPLPVDTDDPIYESGAEDRHVDFALRWSHSFDAWDVGLSHFYGTSREPRFRLNLENVDGSARPVLQPIYDIIHQTSLDLQYTTDEWLWKLEWLTRSGQGRTFTAAIGGFEYTLVGLFDGDADLGLIAEYAFDDRGDEAPTPFENDLVFGARYVMNDEQNTEFLAGVVFDLDDGGRFYSLEASRRLGDDFKLNIEARLNDALDHGDAAYPLRRDDFVQLELAWFF